MRVMFISNLYPPNHIGGYEEMCCEVATEFAAAGHGVTVLTSTYGCKVAEQPQQVIHQAFRLLVGQTIYEPFNGSLARRDTLIRQNIRAFKDVVERDRPDVIFCWNLYGLDGALIAELGRLDLPVVFMLTDNWLAALSRPDFVSRYFKKVVYGGASEKAFLVPSNDLVQMPGNISAIFGADYMRSFYAAAGFVFSSSEVIHNGVELDPTEPRPRARLNDKGKVSLLFAGRVVDVKGAHIAVSAVGELVRLAPETDWRLDIVGDARDEKYMRRLCDLAETLGVRKKIEFVGRVPPEELSEVFASHDVYIFPSLYEPFSLTLIHALASGIPTIASDAGGNPEILVDGENGLLYPKDEAQLLAQKVIDMVRSPERAARLSNAGRRTAQAYGKERMIERMILHLASRVSEASSG